MSPEPGTLQRRLGEALFARVAGPNGPANRARFATPGPRWFAPDRPIRRVHGDAAMFPGGLRALLLQSLHPQAMIAVAQHSDYRNDPWGRLQRTSTFLAATTFGAADDAQRAVDHVRHVHQFITGTDTDGRPYRADDPHLLRWVHVAETDSFLRCHQRYGARPLDAAGCDGYVADTARIAVALGVPDPPQTRGELAEALAAYRPELRATPEALEAARFLVWNPPLPLLARGPYTLLAATAIARTAGLGAARTAAAPAPGRRVRDRPPSRPRHRRHDPLGDGRPPLAGYRSRVTTASACASVTGSVSSLIGTVLYPPSRKITWSARQPRSSG